MDNKKNKILLIGSNGMLGQRTAELFLNKGNTELICASYEQQSVLENINYFNVDLTNQTEVTALLEKISPDVIVNTAAYTAVDKAETEKELCDKVNVDAVRYLANFAKKKDIHLINISTDYVFDGADGPYTEDAYVNPVGYYGLSKLKGEQEIEKSGCRYTIIRTNVLYGPAKHGRMDFVKWVVSSLRDKKEIKIVTDQINNPTYIDDLVKLIDTAIEKRTIGIFNSGGTEFLSRYDFTMRIAEFFNLNKNLIKPVLTAEFNQPAKRPLKSGLILDKTKSILGYKPGSIEDTFRLMKEELSL